MRRGVDFDGEETGARGPRPVAPTETRPDGAEPRRPVRGLVIGRAAVAEDGTTPNRPPRKPVVTKDRAPRLVSGDTSQRS